MNSHPLHEPRMPRHALNFARRGMAVFPLYEPICGACSCGNPDCDSIGKHPRIQRGVLDASTDPEVINEWWKQWPKANIGLACGDRMFVLDVDPRHGGMESLTSLEAKHGKIPETVRVKTGGGGQHAYLSGNGTKIKGRIGLMPGIDIKSAGGYVVAPPSLHASGRRYEFASGSNTIATADPWLVALINGTNGDRKEKFDTAAALSGVPEGKRDETCWRFACSLRRADVPFAAALKLVLEAAANCTPGFSADIAREKVGRAYASYKPAPEAPPHPADDEVLRKEREAIQGEAKPESEPTAPMPERFKIHWASEALEPQPNIPWIVDKLICEGSIAAVVGDAATKKTWSALDMSVCVALGIPWCGIATSQRTVLIVDEESGPRRLMRRLGDVMRGYDAKPGLPVAFTCFNLLDLRAPADRIELTNRALEVGAGLIVIDALADVMLGGDENSVQDLQPVFANLRRMSEEIHGGIALIHHTNRQGKYRGSASLKAAVDLMLMVDSQADNDRVLFTCEKSRDSLIEPFSAIAHFEPGLFRLESATMQGEAVQKLTTAQQYVVRYLRKERVATVKEIMAHADACQPGTARNALYSLVVLKMVYRSDLGGSGSEATYKLVREDVGGSNEQTCHE